MKSLSSGLGQGLAALLGEAAIDGGEPERIHALNVDSILPDPHQPRQSFAEESLRELADSIIEQGVLLPILVRPIKGSGTTTYRLVAGERRWRAARMAGLTEIPALIRHWNDRQALEASILENAQREDLNPVELARGCAELIDRFAYSHKKVAQRLGKSREAITNLLRLLKLPETALGLLETGALSAGHARALLRLEGQPEAMTRLIREVMDNDLSVRRTEALARELAVPSPEEEETQPAPREPTTTTGGRGRQRDPTILSLESRIATALHAPVAITHLRGRGRVILEYQSLDELDALARRLLKEEE
ncbi:MAG: ParB/RepB/Spo0J family partition protein [Magnetococcales bacterium]|nr:ParB/RepB/Spo0J family partition protein [Magnetococcales bacterium]